MDFFFLQPMLTLLLMVVIYSTKNLYKKKSWAKSLGLRILLIPLFLALKYLLKLIMAQILIFFTREKSYDKVL